MKKLNIVGVIVHLLSSLVVTALGISMGFRGTLTLLLFIVLFTDLIMNKTITNNAVIIAIIAIIALYFDNMLFQAKEIKIGNFFTYISKEQQYNNTTKQE